MFYYRGQYRVFFYGDRIFWHKNYRKYSGTGTNRGYFGIGINIECFVIETDKDILQEIIQKVLVKELIKHNFV
jgi:hypothetical protein